MAYSHNTLFTLEYAGISVRYSTTHVYYVNRMDKFHMLWHRVVRHVYKLWFFARFDEDQKEIYLI